MLPPPVFSDSSEWKYTPLSRRRPSSAVARLARWGVLGTFMFVGLLCLFQVISLFLSLSRTVWANDVQAILSTWGYSTDQSSYMVYSTSFTRDIQPIPVHSHNDYWRRVPLYSALEVGCISVEADVWSFKDELYVGHNSRSLTRERTFHSLYVDRIREILDDQNSRGFELGGEEAQKQLKGVYDVAPLQTLHLFIDIKTPGRDTFPIVLQHLEALRSPVNYLTHWNGTDVVNGPVTVHMTGDTPFDMLVANQTYRDVFYDAPLTDLKSDKYNSTNTLISSTPFHKNVARLFWGSQITEKHKDIVRGHVKSAHDKGIMARYWGTPGWPVSLRNKVWRMQRELEVDLLNADDLRAAKELEW